jgi:ankyrin repeat protein
MSRVLPARPSLEHLRKQAKALLRDFNGGDADAIAAFGPRRPTAPAAKLADAQHALARGYGFPNWATLKHHVESLAGDDPAAALGAAVRLDDARRVRDVLARFPSLKGRLDEPMQGGAFGATPLIAAVHLRNAELVDVLLDAGANIDHRSHWWAGSFGVLGIDPAMNAHLIARGATVDAHAAAQLGMLDRLRELVDADPMVVNARFGDGQTPLHVAATPEIAAYLLDHGADIDALDVDHESTPAQHLIRDHQDVVRLLMERGCRTDILMACALGDVELVRRHLDANPESVRTVVSPRWFPMRNARAGGIIYNWTLGNGMSAHAVARAFARDDVYRLLVERTPDDLLVATACESGDDHEVARLLAWRPGLIASLPPDTLMRLPAAAQREEVRTVQLMLGAGWPASTTNESGATALHWAAYRGNAELVRLLLDHGADATAVEPRFGGTPLGWAKVGVGDWNGRAPRDYEGVFDLLSARNA